MISAFLVPDDIDPIAYRIADDNRTIFAEYLDDAIVEGRSKSECVAVVEGCFDTAINVAMETPASSGTYGEDGDIDLLRYLASITVEGFVNSGEMHRAAAAIVDANFDRMSPKTEPKPRHRGYIKTGNAPNRASARTRGVGPKSGSARSHASSSRSRTPKQKSKSKGARR